MGNHPSYKVGDKKVISRGTFIASAEIASCEGCAAKYSPQLCQDLGWGCGTSGIVWVIEKGFLKDFENQLNSTS